MVNKKDLVIAILITFCLTATLFLVKSTRSQSTAPYDPWADANGDGIIDMYDVGYTASMFLSTGDTTKNVNVTNFPAVQPLPTYKIDTYTYINYSWGIGGAHYQYMKGTTEGFSRMSIQITVYNWSTSSPTWLNVSIGSILWTIHEPNGSWGTSLSPLQPPFQPIDIYANGTTNMGTSVGLSGVIETLAPYYSLSIDVPLPPPSPQSGWILMDIFVYFRNE